MRSKLFKFLIILSLLLVGLELLARLNSQYFDALADRMLLKAKILERNPNTEILFLGTSRLLDGVNHHTFTKALQKHTKSPSGFKSLNGATTGLQSDRLAYFSEIAVNNPGLKYVIMEVSPPSMSSGTMKMPESLDTQALEQPQDNQSRFPDRVEDGLQSFLGNHSALVKHRKALRPQILTKLFVLYTANVMDPNIWSRKRPLEAIFLPANEVVQEAKITELMPQVVIPSETTIIEPEAEDFQNLKRIAEIFKDSSIDVIWVAPPVRSKARAANHNENYTKYHQLIANRYQATVYDYAAVDFADDLFSDSSHLNAKGRDVFSKVLAAHLAKRIYSKTSVK